MGIAAEQASDDTLSKIIRALQLATPRPDATLLDPKDHRTGLYNKHMHQFYLEPGIRDTTNTPKLVVPYKLRTKYLHQAHDCVNHSGISHMQEHLSSYWWEFKNRDIRAYVQACARNWSTGHCKRGGKPFKVVYIDFVSMPLSKGKRYILTILDSFSLPPHGHAMCLRPRNRRSSRTLPVLSSSPRDSPHHLLRPRNPLHWWGLQGILWPNLDHPGTSLPVATTKLGEHWEATPDLKKRPLHDLRRQKLWMDGRSRIDSVLNECHSQHHHWCIPALHYHRPPTKHWFYRRSPAKTSLTTTQVLTVCR